MSSFFLSPFLLFFIISASNFYLMFSVNSLFREGFYSIFVCSSNEGNTNNNIAAPTTTNNNNNIELQNVGHNTRQVNN